MMPWLLLLSLPAAALLWFLFTRWEVAYNARRIVDDGARNSLRGAFHLQRTLVRAAVAILLAGAGAWPAPHGFGWLLAGQLAGFAGWFGYAFTPGLNRARGLALYYVSASPTTAWLDRQLWQRTLTAVPPGPWNDAELHQERARYAASELRTLLRAALVAGLAGYAGALVYVWLRSPAAG